MRAHLIGMRTPLLLALMACLLLACSGGGDGPSDEECEQLRNDVLAATSARGLSPVGLCLSEDENIKKDFGEACERLRQCEE
jgi:hypothetical protein